MQTWQLDPAACERLWRRSRADRWHVPQEAFATALLRSVQKAFTEKPDAATLDRYLASLHLEDLALACACASGDGGAWDHFIREYRPTLYRAADAIDPSGGARELADSLYGELFGLTEREGQRRSHFDYFHGRSSLATWLRAVLAQRHVDRIRGMRRFEPLPAEAEPGASGGAAEPAEADRTRYLELISRTLSRVVTALAPRDQIRLACYYGQQLSLAQIGSAIGEHEATVSRNLTRLRKQIRSDVERALREREGLSDAEVSECFHAVVEDPGTLDVSDLLGPTEEPNGRVAAARKDGRQPRSKERAEGARV